MDINSQDIGVELMKEVLAETEERLAFVASNRAIVGMLDAAFAAGKLSDPEFTAGEVLLAAYWYAAGRLKLHDFTLHGVERDKFKKVAADTMAELGALAAAAPEDQAALKAEMEGAKKARKVLSDMDEAMATEGFGGVLKACNYGGSYAAPRAGRYYQALLGNCFRLIKKGSSKVKPFLFEAIDPESVYFPKGVTCIRFGNKPTDRLAVVFKMPLSMALSVFAKEIAANNIIVSDIKGALPRGGNTVQDIDQANQAGLREDEVEVGYFWKISDTETERDKWTVNDSGLMFRCVIGQKMCVLDKQDGNDYEWTFSAYEGAELEPYIPVTQRILYEPTRGVYGYGVGHAVYNIARLHQVVSNQAALDVLESTAPLKFIGIPDALADSYAALYQEAVENRAAGFGGNIPIKNSDGGLSVQSLGGNGDLNKALALKRELELALKRIGIHLDEIQGYAATATQAELDAAKAGEFYEYISKSNAEEAEFELRVALDLFKKSKADNVPLDVRVEYDTEDLTGMTYGDLKELLNKKHWFIELQEESARVPFNALRRMQVREDLKYLPQGSPEFNDAAAELSLLTGRNRKKPKIMPEQIAGQAPAPDMAQPLPPQL